MVLSFRVRENGSIFLKDSTGAASRIVLVLQSGQGEISSSAPGDRPGKRPMGKEYAKHPALEIRQPVAAIEETTHGTATGNARPF